MVGKLFKDSEPSDGENKFSLMPSVFFVKELPNNVITVFILNVLSGINFINRWILNNNRFN